MCKQSICRLHWLMPPPAARRKPHHTSTCWVKGPAGMDHGPFYISHARALCLASVHYQNSAAKLVLKAYKRDHEQPLLQALHWLLVQSRTDYKLSAICHNLFSDSSAYFSDLSVYTPSRPLRSPADTRILCTLFLTR